MTIDEHEVHHWGVLLEDLVPGYQRQMVTIVINEKGVAQGRLSRVEEHAFFCFGPSAEIPPKKERNPRGSRAISPVIRCV